MIRSSLIIPGGLISHHHQDEDRIKRQRGRGEREGGAPADEVSTDGPVDFTDGVSFKSSFEKWQRRLDQACYTVQLGDSQS